MNYAILLRTLDRTPKANYLGATMRSLERGGLWDSRIPFTLTVVDSGSPDPAGFLARELGPLSGRVEVDLPADGRRTHNANATRAMELGALSGADWVLMLEDDIEVCARFLESVDAWLTHHAAPEFPLYTFGCPYPHVEQARRSGRTSWPYPVRDFYGAQCYAVSRARAISLVPWLQCHPLYCGRPRSHDLLLHDWAGEFGAHYYLASVPSFVQHVGRESALDNAYFDFPSFRGTAWEAPA